MVQTCITATFKAAKLAKFYRMPTPICIFLTGGAKTPMQTNNAKGNTYN